MNDDRLRILGKDENKIKERIRKIESEIPQLDLEGFPSPIWESLGTIEEQMKTLKVPGIGIAVINNFEIEWTKSFGVKDVRTQEEITLDTLFEGGSTSKTFTAAAILNAVEQNLLDLDENVNDKLHSWKIPENDFTKRNKITLRQLLTHTAGINRPDSMFEVEEGKIPTINQTLKGELPALNDPVEVCFKPGTEHSYSNLGYIIIQKLYEDITRKKLPEIMKEVVFNPLGIENSTFEYPTGELKKKAIVPHNQDGEARETGLHPGASGHGGLLTTPFDLSLFLIELMKAFNGESNKILSSEMAKQMLSSQVKIDPAKFFGWTGQGFGIFLIEEEDKLLLTHPGTNMPGATCMMIFNPKTGQGAVIMANGINGELLNIQILFAIVKEYSWPSMWLLK
ncbi:MAG: beta-lactamase family protein [Asgard group archaeon]|nr:beta-lactamase family protein [Asgard group archaeon]